MTQLFVYPEIQEAKPGDYLPRVATALVAMAKEKNMCVVLNFNGVHVVVTPEDTLETVDNKYNAGFSLKSPESYLLESVGYMSFRFRHGAANLVALQQAWNYSQKYQFEVTLYLTIGDYILDPKDSWQSTIDFFMTAKFLKVV